MRPPDVEPEYIGGEEDKWGQKFVHPAFGQIRVSKPSGHKVLYGSDFVHHNYVTIEIGTSEHHRNLSHDWHFSNHEIITVALSEAQWATLVSSFGSGSGVPCTIEHIRGEQKPGIKLRDITQIHWNEIAASQTNAERSLDDLIKQIDSMKISGKAKETLRRYVDAAIRELTSNAKFRLDAFGKYMEETVEKGKVEVEAYINNAIRRAGIEAIAADFQPPKLIEGNSDGKKPNQDTD